MEKYKTIEREISYEFTEKKSRFIGWIAPVASQEEFSELLERKKKQYWDATHNCSAVIIGAKKEFMRFSDDGEPQGTAGLPMLEALKQSGLTDLLAVATRYFGGTLLGAGGLVRAYSKSVAGALKAAEEQGAVLEMIPSAAYDAVLPYAAYGKLENLLAQRGYQKQDVRFEQDVAVRILVDAELEKTFLKDMTEAFCGSAEPKRVLECYAKRYCKK